MKKQILLAALSASLIFTYSPFTLAENNDEKRELKREQRQEMLEIRKKHRAERMLLNVDLNQDGKIDLNEYLVHAEARFKKLDANADGLVTPEEAETAMSKMRERHKERRKEFRERRNQRTNEG